MSPAERKKRSRLKLKQAGGKEYQVKINKKQLEAIKHYSKLKQTNQSENQTIKTLLQEALEHISYVITEANKINNNNSMTHNDVIIYLDKKLFPK